MTQFQDTRQRPSIAVIIPTYNQADYVAEAIDSALAQEFAPVEIIVSENYSTDDTAQILEKYRDRVRIVRPPHHMPMMEHWNFAISNATADWFTIISSDDRLQPDALRLMGECAAKVPGCVLVRGGVHSVDGDGRVLHSSKLASLRAVTDCPQTFLEQLCGPCVSFAAFCADRRVVKSVGGFPTSCHLNGDWGLWLKLSPLGRVGSVHKAIGTYRVGYRPGFDRKRILRSLLDDVAIMEEIIPGVAVHFEDYDLHKIYRVTGKRLAARLAAFSRETPPLPEEERKEIGKAVRRWAELSGQTAVLVRFVSGYVWPAPGRLFSLVSRAFSHLETRCRTLTLRKRTS